MLSVLIDTQGAFSKQFFQGVVGIDCKKLKYVSISTIQGIFRVIQLIIEKTRQKNSDIPICIVVDSVAGASSQTQQASGWQKDGYSTTKPIVISKALRKMQIMLVKQNITLIFTNQLRMSMNAMAFSDPYVTPNGLAIPHHASVRLRLTKATAIKDTKSGVKIGLNLDILVKKNRVGPPLRKCSIPLYFGSGIDNYGS